MEQFPQESKSCEMERKKLTLQISDVAPLTLGDQRPSVALLMSDGSAREPQGTLCSRYTYVGWVSERGTRRRGPASRTCGAVG